jgi:hypothetical protein
MGILFAMMSRNAHSNRRIGLGRMSLLKILRGETGVSGIVWATCLVLVSKDSHFYTSHSLFHVYDKRIDDVGAWDNVVVVRII